MNSGTGTTTGGAQDAQLEESKRKAEATRQKAAAEAQAGGETVAEEAKAVGQKAGELGREHAERRFDQGKERIEGQVDAVSSALDDAAEKLHAENSPLASYADELSGQLSRLSHGIETSTLDDVAVKTRRVARENPGLFVLGSVVAGLAAARFFKASAERERRERYADDDRYGRDDHGYGGRNDYREGSYRDGGATSRTTADYRSPVTSTTAPPRAAATTGGGEGRGTTGTGSTSSTSAATPSVSRVPMDSDSTSGTTGAAATNIKTGA